MDRKLYINGKEHKFTANALSTIFYKKEFNSDLMTDIAKLKKIDIDDFGGLDTTILLQVAFVYEQTANYTERKDIIPFFDWAAEIENLESIYEIVIDLSIKLYSKKKPKQYNKTKYTK